MLENKFSHILSYIITFSVFQVFIEIFANFLVIKFVFFFSSVVFKKAAKSDLAH